MQSYSRRYPLVMICLLLALWAGAVPSYAQVQAPALPAGPLTLEQVLELAESRSESIAIAQAGVRRAEGEQTRAFSGRYPQLSFSAAYDRSLANEFEGVFDSGAFGGSDDGTDGTGTDDNAFEDLPFGRLNTWRIALSLTQNIYSGGRLGAQAAVAAAGRGAAELNISTARAQLLFDVTQAYYDAAMSDRLVSIAEASLEQAGATLKQTQAGFDAGTQPEFEVLRARVNRDSQTPLIIRQRVNRDVALLRLKQMLDLPQDYDLRLADALADEGIPGVGSACGDRHPVRRDDAVADGRQRGGGHRPAARGDVEPGGGAGASKRVVELDVRANRLPVERDPHLRPQQLVGGGEPEPADPDRRPPEG
jgi:outer membrane protein TolC